MANWTGIGEIGKEEIIGDPMAGEERGTERNTDTVDPMETVDPMVDPTEAEDPVEDPMEAKEEAVVMGVEEAMEGPMEGCRY